MKWYVVKKKNSNPVEFEILKLSNTAGYSVVGESPIDSKTNNQIVDINLITIKRFYMDDQNIRHDVAEGVLIPSRVVQINKGMTTAEPIFADVQFEEKREIITNDSAIQTFYTSKLNDLKNNYIQKILSDCDSKISILKIGYSSEEVSSWPIKKMLAIQWLALSGAQKTSALSTTTYSLIINEACGDSNSDKVTNTDSLANKIIQLAAIFESYVGSCVKAKKEAMKQINLINSEYSTAESEIQTIYSNIQWPTVQIPQ